jgi:NADPH2:quinone reductase
VAFGANVDTDVDLLKTGGSIGAYATDIATPKIAFRLKVFKNVRVFFLGSDDFPTVAATRDLNGALQAGRGFKSGSEFRL